MENSGSTNQKSGKALVGLILLGLGFILLFIRLVENKLLPDGYLAGRYS